MSRQRKKKEPVDRFEHAVAVFRSQGPLLRTRQAIRAGVHPATLYAMRDAGTLEKESRGVYRLAGTGPLGNPDLVIVATRVPHGVICLISALAFHELTTQVPHEVYVALPRGTEEPRLDYPPLRTFRFEKRAFSEGVEIHEVDGVKVRIYSPEKTLVDCFKFRNKIGLDAATEALRLYIEGRRLRLDDVMRFAKICRVARIMRPYLEAVL
jgi:predicted transcriptional regulator of viral defense system